MLAQEAVFHDEDIHVGEHEAAVGAGRTVNNGFTANIEAGVDQNRASGALFEGFQDGVKTR